MVDHAGVITLEGTERRLIAAPLSVEAFADIVARAAPSPWQKHPQDGSVLSTDDMFGWVGGGPLDPVHTTFNYGYISGK